MTAISIPSDRCVKATKGFSLELGRLDLGGSFARLVRKIDWPNAKFRNDEGLATLIAPPLGVHSVKMREIEALKSEGARIANFWTLAFGRPHLSEAITNIALVGVSDFSKSLMEWIQSDGKGLFQKCAETTIGEMGGIDLETAKGAVFWKRSLSSRKLIGTSVYVLASIEADEFVCHVIDKTSGKILASQYIDPKTGLLFSWISTRSKPLQREYAARVDENHRTHFDKIPILWPLKTLHGHIGRWITDEEGKTISEFSSMVNRSLHYRHVLSTRQKADTIVAYVLGKEMGSADSRYYGIAGWIKVPIIGINPELVGISYTRRPVPLSQETLVASGMVDAKEIEVEVKGPHIVNFASKEITTKLIHRFNTKTSMWELSSAETRNLPAALIEDGIVMVQGIRLSKYANDGEYAYLGYRIGGGNTCYLCRIDSDTSNYPHFATAILAKGKVICMTLDYRVPADHAIITRLGELLSKSQDERTGAENKELARYLNEFDVDNVALAAAVSKGDWSYRELSIIESRIDVTRKASVSLDEAREVLKKWQEFRDNVLPTIREKNDDVRNKLLEFQKQIQQSISNIKKHWTTISAMDDAKKTYLSLAASLKNEIAVLLKRTKPSKMTSQALMDWVEGVLPIAKNLTFNWERQEDLEARDLEAMNLLCEYEEQKRRLSHAQSFEMDTNRKKIAQLTKLVDALKDLLGEEQASIGEQDSLFDLAESESPGGDEEDPDF